MRVSLQPAVPTEIKRLAEDQGFGRLKQLPLGQQVRHPLTPLAVALGFLPALKPEDLRVLVEDKSMNPALRDYLRAEVDRRLRRRHP